MTKTARAVLAVGFVISAATASLAGPIGATGSFSLTRVDGLKGGSGGEFTVYDIRDAAGQPSTAVTNASYSASPATKNVPSPFPGGPIIPDSLQTFCLEVTEQALLTASNYFVVNSFAAAGGGGSLDARGSVNGRYYISKGTAWLYSQFAQGGVTSFDVRLGRPRATCRQHQGKTRPADAQPGRMKTCQRAESHGGTD